MGLSAALEQYLLSLEEDLLQPVTRKDAGKLASLLHEDFVELGSSGRVFDKSSVIATLGDEVPVHSIISQFKASPLGQDAVLVTYRGERASPRRANFSAVVARSRRRRCRQCSKSEARRRLGTIRNAACYPERA